MNADNKIMPDNWEKIKVGDQASFAVVVDEEMVLEFIKITGDNNRLHNDDAWAQAKGFPKRVAHGMLLASLFSRLLGKYFLGDDNLYLAQSTQFKKPVLAGDEVTVAGQVIQKTESAKTITVQTTITRQTGEVAVAGQAVVKLL